VSLAGADPALVRRLVYFWRYLGPACGEKCTARRLMRLAGGSFAAVLAVETPSGARRAEVRVEFTLGDGGVWSVCASGPGAWDREVGPDTYLDLPGLVAPMLSARTGWGSLRDALLDGTAAADAPAPRASVGALRDGTAAADAPPPRAAVGALLDGTAAADAPPPRAAVGALRDGTAAEAAPAPSAPTASTPLLRQ